MAPSTTVYAALTDEQIAELALDLGKLEREAGWARTLEIGELILRRCYGGDVDRFRDKRKSSHESIRRLARRHDCPLEKSALSEAVGVYVVVHYELPRVRTSGHLSPSHVACVLGLCDDERAQLLECAREQRWSVRQLRQKIRDRALTPRVQRGRPRSPAAVKAVTRMQRALHDWKSAHALLRSSQSVDTGSLADMSTLVEECLSAITAVRAELSVLGSAPGPRLLKPPASADDDARAPSRQTA